MIFIIPVILAVINFFLQSYPRFFNRFFGVDVWTRLIEIDQVRKAGHKIPDRIDDGFLIKGSFDYPIIFPFIFSFFSKKTLLNIQGFVSPFFDSLNNILVFIVAYYATSSWLISSIAQAIYIFTPMVVVENSYLTPRSLGYLLFSLSFFPLLLFFLDKGLIFLLISLLFSTLLYLTHRFALQSFIFICIFYAIFNFSLIFLITPIVGFIIAVIITKGYYLRVLKGHLSNIQFWITNTNYRFAHQVYGINQNGKHDWVSKIYSLLSNFSPLFLFATNIWTASGFIFFALINLGDHTLNGALFYQMAIWIVFFYIFGSIVLRIKKLIPIGEGQRYLEMTTLPSSILSALLLHYFYKTYGLPIIVIGILLISGNLFLILFIQIKGIIKDKNRSLTSDMKEAYSFINSLPGKPHIMCIPHQITTMTIYNTKAQILVNADNSGLLKLKGVFPLLTKSLEELKKEYKLDYLLLKKSFVHVKDLKLKHKKVIFKKGDILLIKL